MTDEDKKINEAVYSWLCQPEYEFYEEEMERSFEVERDNLETTPDDHRYVQGRLSAFKQMLNYKAFLREYLDDAE